MEKPDYEKMFEAHMSGESDISTLARMYGISPNKLRKEFMTIQRRRAGIDLDEQKKPKVRGE